MMRSLDRKILDALHWYPNIKDSPAYDVYRRWRFPRSWRPLVRQIRLARELIARVPQPLIFDIGANRGDRTALWKAAHVFCHEASRGIGAWVTRRLLNILQGNGSQVAGGIRRSATRRRLTPEERKYADACSDYLLNHEAYLRYHQYLEDRLPIATGVIERACRHLVKDRMEITGARWSLVGGEVVLRHRALRASCDFDPYWRFQEAQEYQRHHVALYTEGNVPPPANPPCPRPPTAQGASASSRRHHKETVPVQPQRTVEKVPDPCRFGNRTIRRRRCFCKVHARASEAAAVTKSSQRSDGGATARSAVSFKNIDEVSGR